jgi:nicotinamide mononucleotide transporter
MSQSTLHIVHTKKRDVIESIIVAFVLTTVSYLIAIIVGWEGLKDLNLLEVFAVLTSYACTYLCVKERRINYPIGVVSSAAYSYLFLQNGLIASAILNAYLVPTLVYGYIRWRKDQNTRPVTHVRIKWIPVYLIVAGLGYTGAAFLSAKLGGALAWTDAVVLAGTILAQFLLDNKKLENWIIWAIVNVFAIYTYATTGLPLVALQYVFFLANTVYGYIMWRRSMNHGKSIRSDDSNATDNGTLTTRTVR